MNAMRLQGILFCAVVTVSATALAATELPLKELKARATAASPDQQPALCIQVAERELKEADRLYAAGDVEHGRAAVGDLVNFATKARDASVGTGKRLKHTEIAVRKMAHALTDIKRTLNFEDQAPLQAAVDELERIRTSLLAKMFGKGEK